MGWVRRWRVEVRLRVGYGDRTEPRRAEAADIAGVRRLVARARANPDVVAWRLTSEDVLDHGDRPSVCWSCGGELEPDGVRHAATGRSRLMETVSCRACPGHERIRCPDCKVGTVWPAATVGCGPPRAEWEEPTARREWLARGETGGRS